MILTASYTDTVLLHEHNKHHCEKMSYILKPVVPVAPKPPKPVDAVVFAPNKLPPSVDWGCVCVKEKPVPAVPVCWPNNPVVWVPKPVGFAANNPVWNSKTTANGLPKNLDCIPRAHTTQSICCCIGSDLPANRKTQHLQTYTDWKLSLKWRGRGSSNIGWGEARPRHGKNIETKARQTVNEAKRDRGRKLVAEVKKYICTFITRDVIFISSHSISLSLFHLFIISFSCSFSNDSMQLSANKVVLYSTGNQDI